MSGSVFVVTSIGHYSNGVQDHPNLSPLMRNNQGDPVQLRINPDERAALIAFVNTLTDDQIANDKRFSDPFDAPFPDTTEAQVLREEAEAPPVGTNN